MNKYNIKVNKDFLEARSLNNIVIRPVNTIYDNCSGKYNTHILDIKFINKLTKYLNKNGYKYNWQEVTPN